VQSFRHRITNHGRPLRRQVLQALLASHRPLGAAGTLKASSRAAGFSSESPEIEIVGICSQCRER